MKTIRWGILSTAKIARNALIPALQASSHNQVLAICSRDAANAQQWAQHLGIERAYSSYEALLADPDIDAIYNPLPNHLHVDWSIKALAAGKHVLCEKPLGLDSADAQRLVDAAAAHPHLKVMEAFMYRFHPQWQQVKNLIAEGRIGQLRHVQAHFSYNNRDTDNIRNKRDWGGGALLDVGCYCISVARLLFGDEPTRVLGHITPFAGQEVDCLVSGVLEFAQGNATFTAATKIEPMQYVEAYGEAGSLRIEVPFNPLAQEPARLLLKNNREPQVFNTEAIDQYRLMAEAFAQSIVNNTPVPSPLSDAMANMRIIDALFASADSNQWVALERQ